MAKTAPGPHPVRRAALLVVVVVLADEVVVAFPGQPSGSRCLVLRPRWILLAPEVVALVFSWSTHRAESRRRCLHSQSHRTSSRTASSRPT